MLQRGLLGLLLASLLVVGPSSAPFSMLDDAWPETRFWTGCSPGPTDSPAWPENVATHVPAPGPARTASLQVDLDSAAAHRPLLGSGFNFEHALWSCPAFRGIFRQQILDPFSPALARVDTGLLPAAPSTLPASQLGPAIYRSVLASTPYADSWRFMQRLNRAGVRIVLGVWGGPPQFTDDGTRRGTLLPAHYDDYVDYVATLVDFLVRDQGIQVWATTIANEPDGGDGNQIPPDGLAYIAHRLAERLAPLGVQLYGPDTANGSNALQYLPPLLDDPLVAQHLAFVGFHEYYASQDVGSVVDYVRQRAPDLPVVVTEYTSFSFGDLDAGQEADDRIGFTLDIANTLLSHYQHGADAALYWDAVDYLQPGHEAITRWGLLRGPSREFARRTRYYGLLQVLPYLQPGARVLTSRQDDLPDLGTLAIQTPAGAPAVFLVNQGSDEVDLSLDLQGAAASQPTVFGVWRTDREHKDEPIGRLQVQDGLAQLALPPRSLTTLYPPTAALESADAGG